MSKLAFSHASIYRLTAYVAKVFAMSSDLIVIEENVICSALNWLATKKQLSDGTFKEDAPVYHSEMVVSKKKNPAKITDTLLLAIPSLCSFPGPVSFHLLPLFPTVLSKQM